MNVYSQEQWCDMTASIVKNEKAWDELMDVLGTRTNPNEQDSLDMSDVPEDAVCIHSGLIEDIDARADWLAQDGDEETANVLVNFTTTLRLTPPSRSMIVAALVKEGKA